MGLDMYLSGRRYMSKLFREDDEPKMNAIAALFPELEGRFGRWGDSTPVKEIRIEAGYWRKANQIHKWFVDNVQEGEDDCGNYWVSREQLTELRDVCQRVLDFKHLADELLPRQQGFFFGNTDYDEWYYKDIEHTVKIIDECLTLPLDWDFEYHSSW